MRSYASRESTNSRPKVKLLPPPALLLYHTALIYFHRNALLRFAIDILSPDKIFNSDNTPYEVPDFKRPNSKGNLLTTIGLRILRIT
jgi:hypothetical protein